MVAPSGQGYVQQGLGAADIFTSLYFAEATMLAGAKGLDNLVFIVDYNFVQSEGPMDLVMSLEPQLDKIASFGFACQEVDGNDIGALLAAFDTARATKGKPSFIKASTLMGKGVASLEGLMFHQLRFPAEVAESARAELEAQL
ncbi:hypothetical protein [Candidatus Rhodobacter oscarellae]|nr:hypothetical protein [Candidatus Rhodobacter lobularis]